MTRLVWVLRKQAGSWMEEGTERGPGSGREGCWRFTAGKRWWGSDTGGSNQVPLLRTPEWTSVGWVDRADGIRAVTLFITVLLELAYT